MGNGLRKKFSGQIELDKSKEGYLCALDLIAKDGSIYIWDFKLWCLEVSSDLLDAWQKKLSSQFSFQLICFKARKKIVSKNIVLCIKSRITKNKVFYVKVEKTHSSNQVIFDNIWNPHEIFET